MAPCPVDLNDGYTPEVEGPSQGHKQGPYVGRGTKGRISGVIARGDAALDGEKMPAEATGGLVRPAD